MTSKSKEVSHVDIELGNVGNSHNDEFVRYHADDDLESGAPSPDGTKPPSGMRAPMLKKVDSKGSGFWNSIVPLLSPPPKGSTSTPPASSRKGINSTPPVSAPERNLPANQRPSWKFHGDGGVDPLSAVNNTQTLEQLQASKCTVSEPVPAIPVEPHPVPIFPELSIINENTGETSILEDLERKVGFGTLGGGGQGSVVDFAGFNTANGATATTNSAPVRSRSTSLLSMPQDLYSRVRLGRKLAQDSQDYVGFEDTPVHHSTGLKYLYYRTVTTITYLTPNFYVRMNIYFLVLFLLVISVVAQDNSPAVPLLTLFGSTCGLELATSILDRMVYKIIDVVFESRFDIAYQMHSLNGPLGFIIAIVAMKDYWRRLDSAHIFPEWNNFLTAAAVLVICLAGKNWLTRKQYIHLLESRFAAKVENLNTMIIILSELASTRPPKSVQLKHASDQLAAKNSEPAFRRGHNILHITAKVKNVFEDIVDSAEEESSDDMQSRREMYEKRRSFWQSAARLNATAGSMKVITYNGIVSINNQAQAKDFGKKLFKHVSRAGKVIITPSLIRRLFEERREIVNRDLDEKADHDQAMAAIVSGQASQALHEHEEEKQDLWMQAVTMFDPFNLGKISEDFCAEAVLNIYKEQRFTAASISDFGELHQSLRIGIDIIYWIIMIFVLQAIFGFDISTYLLPFITLLLTFSFAIAPLVGNVFLAFAFVFFMSPYDVGHKVQFGLFNVYTPPVVGYIKSVTLLYTVVTSSKNETVKIPNHTLYAEKIFNMTETAGAVHDFAISFNIFGTTNCDMDKITTFFQRLKHYTLRESREWKSFLCVANLMDAASNTMEYKVYCTHREGWGFIEAVSAAKIEYYGKIKSIREELGLTFMKTGQAVAVADNGGAVQDNIVGISHDENEENSANEDGLRSRSNAVLTAEITSTALSSTDDFKKDL